MIVFKGKYLLILVLCQDSIFSSQGHVSSMRTTFLKLFEKIVMSGLSWVKAMWTGKQQLLLRSAIRNQSDAWCKMPTSGLHLRGTFALFFTNFIDVLAEIGTASVIFEMKILRVAMNWRKTVSCLNLYLSWSTLQAPKICAVVHTSLLHMVHMVSVVIPQLLRLLGNGSMSYVEARQKEVRLAGIANKEAQEKSCCKSFIYLVHWPCTCSWTTLEKS